MTVYVDVLVGLNLLVDYFLLLCTARLLNLSATGARRLLSSLAGAVSSLYIFVPSPGIAADIGFRIIIVAGMSLIAFGFGDPRRFFKNTLSLFAVNCVFTGVMEALYWLWKPLGMAVNNTVVYFNFSPVLLVVFTVLFYLLLSVLHTLYSKKSAFAQRCTLTVCAEENSIELKGILDTGNSVRDVFGTGEVIIVDQKSVDALFRNPVKEKNDRFRVIPCRTVAGSHLLEAYRCDSGEVLAGGRNVKLKNPILAVSKTALPEDCSAILNPEILE